MGPRASRRKVVTISDDEDDEVHPEEIEQDSPVPQRRATGKLKSVQKTQSSVTRASKIAASQDSSPKQKAKVTNTTKDPPKRAGKPIYSFFNNATQRQQTSQPSRSPEKALRLHEVEAIHDDSDSDSEKGHQDEATTPLSKGSSTAMAMRKRKFPRMQTAGDEADLPPAASQKFRKTGGGDRVPSFNVTNDDKRPWTEQFAPHDLSELAVHKRKVADVRTWLETTFRGRRQKVLVLKGAAGTGKTVTLQLIAKEMGVEIIEWKDTSGLESSESFVSTASRFEEFVGRGGASGSLVLSANATEEPRASDYRSSDDEKASGQCPQVLLIEEFPNTFSRTSSTLQSFRSTISQYVASPMASESMSTPIVMIISETLLSTNTAAADSFTAHRLLGPELITNPYVNVIEFNPVAPTYLVKALEMIVVKEARKSGRRRTPGLQVLKQLAETGDIRSAVSSLEFICLRGDDADTWSSKVAFTKPKQSKTQAPLTKSEEEALKLVTNRESSLGIFHSVGKVVYNKRTEIANVCQPPPWLPQHRRSKVAETDPDTLIDELGTDTPTFLAALHENYALSCSSSGAEDTLDSVLGCMESLSDADLLSLDRFSFGTRAFSGSTTDSLRQDEMCFQVAVRGMLFSLPNPVHRSAAASGNRADAHRMFYPASLKLWRKKEEIEGKLGLLAKELLKSGEMTLPSTVSSAPSSGVESWKQNTNFKSSVSSANGGEDTVQPQMSTEAKNELLMDRLPYMMHVLSSSKAHKSQQSILDRLLDVTRISGSLPNNDDDAEQEEGEDPSTNVEQWTTDRPDAEAGPASTSPKKQRVPSKQKAVFEAMSIPVEPRVDKLVLEDDDIVDD